MQRMTMFRASVLALAGAAALLAAPPRAEAQIFKKIKEKAAGAAVDKAAKKVTGEDSAKSATAGAAPTSATGASATTAARPDLNAPLEITSARIDAFLGAVKPAFADYEREKKERAAVEDYKAATQKFEECRQKVASNPANAGKGNDKETERYSELTQKVTEEMLKAQAATDTARMRVLTDSITVLTDKQYAATFPAVKQCGARPVAPKSASAKGAHGGGRQQVTIAAVPGMSSYQFGLLREKIAAYVLTKGAFGPGYKLTYTPAELDALKTRSGDLAVIEPYLRDGTLEWKSWYDLHGW